MFVHAAKQNYGQKITVSLYLNVPGMDIFAIFVIREKGTALNVPGMDIFAIFVIREKGTVPKRYFVVFTLPLVTSNSKKFQKRMDSIAIKVINNEFC